MTRLVHQKRLLLNRMTLFEHKMPHLVRRMTLFMNQELFFRDKMPRLELFKPKDVDRQTAESCATAARSLSLTLSLTLS
jgi:hypothetical protein